MENESDDKVMDGKGYPESGCGYQPSKIGPLGSLTESIFFMWHLPQVVAILIGNMINQKIDNPYLMKVHG
jgi:hypothetical protein